MLQTHTVEPAMTSEAPAVHDLSILARRGHLREVGMSALIFAIAMLLSALILLGVNVSAMQHNFVWVQQADDVLLQIWGVESGITGDEMSVRGYALTDDPRFLTYQQTNRHRTAESMRKLGLLVAGDSSEAARFAALRKITSEHLNYFGALTRLGPGHARDVASAIVSVRCRTVMTEMRAQLSSYRSHELALLAGRQAQAAQQASNTYALSVGIVVAAFLIGGLGMLASRTRQKA
jgi:CHASE3 domain sensor protein